MNHPDPIAHERRARLAAERLLELKQAELFAANEKLSKHALALSGEIIERREEVEEVRDQNSRVLSDLEQANQAIDIAERRLWDSLETIEDGFAVYDPSNVMIAANSAYLSVFDNMECVGPGTSYEEIAEILVQEGIVDTGEMSDAEWRDDIVRRWSADQPETRTIKLWNGQFIKLVDRRSRDGDMVSLALNITSTIRYEEKLKDARARAETANHAKSAFLAKMSHELRTPMNGVVGMADLLVETPLNEEQLLFVDTIKTSGEALLLLINDVLDFSKIEAEKLVLVSEHFDLERCIHEVMLLFQPAVLEKGIELILDYDLFLPTGFVGDAGRLRQVLTNLVGNAIKFTETGHVAIRVVGLPQADENEFRIHLTVEDTGIGIAKDMVDHIFGEFNQVEDEKNRKFEGTGLGLAITQQLIELMGGKIWVDSDEGVGSNFGFHLTLPAPAGPPNLPDALPAWMQRVLVPACGSLTAGIVGKQLAALGIPVVENAICDTTDDLQLMNGDAIVADTRFCGEEFWQKMQSAMSPGAWVPVLLIQSGTDENLPPLDSPIIPLKPPVSRLALVAAISELVVPETALPPGEVAADRVQDATVDSIPLEVPRTNLAEQGETEAPDDSAEVEPRLMRILAAEDNKTNRLVFGKLVRHLNIELEFAENGRQAVEKWKEFRPDLVFMDISMPEMDGKQATAAIRAEEAETGRPHTPIVALTAHAMDGDDQEILSSGLDHYLTKPLRKDAIFGQIAEVCPDTAVPVFPDPDVAALKA